MDKDTVVGIVGAVILIAAMVGVFYYEGTSADITGAGGSGWAVTWTTGTMGGPTADGDTQEGQTSSETLTISAANLTKIEFTLSWTDNVGSADEFRLVVHPPGGGAPKEVTGSQSPLTVVFEDLNAVPTQDEVGGSNEGEARARLAGAHTKTGGTGEYHVEVTLVSAGDQMDPTGTIVIQADDNNAWSLAARLTTYSASVTSA